MVNERQWTATGSATVLRLCGSPVVAEVVRRKLRRRRRRRQHLPSVQFGSNLVLLSSCCGKL